MSGSKEAALDTSVRSHDVTVDVIRAEDAPETLYEPITSVL